jgi:predicted transcriptional regulator
MAARRAGLGDQELQILKIVWDRRSATVRDVYQDLLARRHVAYTTVMTMMNILEQKGYLRKRPGPDRAFVYTPARSKQAVVGGLVRDFVDRVFNGSAAPLVVHLIEDERISPEELAELRRLARKKG